ncbi:MAG TPA: cob(I)yrinic acid a,c-diamide adenosyltransferase [Victivallales bacterium]|nr:cob(I)yrinic acid a,c-diamide adenosyltransferase [Victivallales bacterium]HPO90504.1 cob(I)yrinic acid a,c-diamide adenosyltransferase [Victivallales bacterium]HRU01166.1 cob(I)yrinic acid a,c-diamide adenosyltransferase [Victivallales bacterium]
MKKEGMIQIYTGNGKGKTTAAFGLAIRALGANLKVFIAQFIKKGNSSEIKFIQKLNSPNIYVKSYGRGRFFKKAPEKKDIEDSQNALLEIIKITESGKYDVVIVDEIFPAIKCGLIDESLLIDLIERKSDKTELILTGRGASKKVISMAQLVTEMKEIKHYYKNGLKARIGIEF